MALVAPCALARARRAIDSFFASVAEEEEEEEADTSSSEADTSSSEADSSSSEDCGLFETRWRWVWLHSARALGALSVAELEVQRARLRANLRKWALLALLARAPESAAFRAFASARLHGAYVAPEERPAARVLLFSARRNVALPPPPPCSLLQMDKLAQRCAREWVCFAHDALLPAPAEHFGPLLAQLRAAAADSGPLRARAAPFVRALAEDVCVRARAADAREFGPALRLAQGALRVLLAARADPVRARDDAHFAKELCGRLRAESLQSFAAHLRADMVARSRLVPRGHTALTALLEQFLAAAAATSREGSERCSTGADTERDVIGRLSGASGGFVGARWRWTLSAPSARLTFEPAGGGATFVPLAPAGHAVLANASPVEGAGEWDAVVVGPDSRVSAVVEVKTNPMQLTDAAAQLLRFLARLRAAGARGLELQSPSGGGAAPRRVHCAATGAPPRLLALTYDAEPHVAELLPVCWHELLGSMPAWVALELAARLDIPRLREWVRTLDEDAHWVGALYLTPIEDRRYRPAMRAGLRAVYRAVLALIPSPAEAQRLVDSVEVWVLANPAAAAAAAAAAGGGGRMNK